MVCICVASANMITNISCVNGRSRLRVVTGQHCVFGCNSSGSLWDSRQRTAAAELLQ